MSRVDAKVARPTLAGALATVLVFAAGLAGVEVPAEVAASAVVVLGAVVGYFSPHTPRPELNES
ncbi:hypothetical protein CDO52_26935 [Nocardiopsis gilva YIM 90087]|uniref:Holin n=1 Tax=Nocardiopsis gilva YIM 90087 TaxID=1235441 RepID=A0A223RZX1_9ACTN|nr:hypothetical protein [Nocardiopsis gilva]ASU81398.1 hypothetical protein CDO52_00140 [Nocardiopsis gilva YIM 90087]ASU85944.1 hypothetical protein CDO52_26935 [Nocardiopsis gilva YIM 90087]